MNNPTYVIFVLLDVVYYLCSLDSLNKQSWYTCLESEQVSNVFLLHPYTRQVRSTDHEAIITLYRIKRSVSINTDSKATRLSPQSTTTSNWTPHNANLVITITYFNLV
jgi:hypothetical protein